MTMQTKILIIFLGLVPSISMTGLIRIDAVGTVYSIDPVFSEVVEFGDMMTASFLYNTEEISRTINFDVDRAFHYTNSLEYTVRMGSILVSGSGGRIESTNDYTDSSDRFKDRYIVQRGGVGTVESNLYDIFDIANLSAGITFYDYVEAAALSSASQYVPDDFSLFDKSAVSVQLNLDDGVFDWLPVFARVSDFRVTHVSEPSPLALLSLSLLCLITQRRYSA